MGERVTHIIPLTPVLMLKIVRIHHRIGTSLYSISDNARGIKHVINNIVIRGLIG